jgi:hypothetical protein
LWSAPQQQNTTVWLHQAALADAPAALCRLCFCCFRTAHFTLLLLTLTGWCCHLCLPHP